MSDESEIRELQQAWFRATNAGDLDAVRSLMTEDVVFLTPGRAPFGLHEFLDSFEAMREQVRMDCRGEYEEIMVAGAFAYARAKLDVRVTPGNGAPPRRLTGNTLSIFRRCPDGMWRLYRDANLLTPAD